MKEKEEDGLENQIIKKVNETENCILNKLRIINENLNNNLLQKTNIALIKSSNDNEIEELINRN